MRTAAALLTVLCTGVLSQALAADPQSPSSPPAPAAATPAEPQSRPPGDEKSTAAPAAQPVAAAAASGSAPKPAAAPNGDKPELTPQDKELLARGYKLEMRHGDKYFCRKEQQIGSRFEVKYCNTAESIEAQRENSAEALRRVETNRPTINN